MSSIANVTTLVNPVYPVRVSEAAARIYVAVRNGPAATFRFGYDKMAIVADLTDVEVRRGIDELRRHGVLRVPNRQPGMRQVLIASQGRTRPVIELGQGTIAEIVRLAQVDFDCLSHVPACGKLRFDDASDPPSAHAFELSHRCRFPVLEDGVRLLLESSPAIYLDYLLYGNSAFGSAQERVRTLTNWTPRTGGYANELTITDGQSCNDLSLAAYWLWCVGYQRAMHGQLLEFPNVLAVAPRISAMVKAFSLPSTICMLGYAAFNWRTLSRLTLLRPMCLGRFPTASCWANPGFSEIVYQHLLRHNRL